MTNKIIDYQMELARPYRLWTTYGKWLCVDEVVINRTTYQNGATVYSVEVTDYRRIAQVNDTYMTVLRKLETYADDDAEHYYEEVIKFYTFEEAVRYVDRFYPPVDFEKELERYYVFDEDDE